MAIEERVSGMQLSQENENLKAEIRDLNEKLETLKSKKFNFYNPEQIFYYYFDFLVRRNQDKEKLKEADKMRLQLDQLLEFKRAILESQSQLQKELQRVKQEAKDALIDQQSKNHDNDEYQEMLEMATLDKEMAEEKVSFDMISIKLHIYLTLFLISRLKVSNWSLNKLSKRLKNWLWTLNY